MLTADEAAALVPAGAVVTVSGAAGNLVPDSLLKAVRERFDGGGEPAGLTVICPVAVGDVFDIPGLDHLAHPALMKSVLCGSYVYGRSPVTGKEPELTRLVFEGEVEAYNFGIGVIYAAIRDAAAGRGGLLTRVGLGSFQDPRHRGGRLNQKTPPRFVDHCVLDGEEYLRYRLPRIDVALLRATTADELGNISTEREAIDGGLLVQAIAAHNNRGRVIVQVERLARANSLRARDVRIPGALVDAVVVAPGERQTTGIFYDPYLSGELTAPEVAPEPVTDPAERLILEKVASRLDPGSLVILGFGIPSQLPNLRSLPRGVRFCVEHGAIGGAPVAGLAFGGGRNLESLIDSPSMFDLIDGGGCDATCLGFSEVAEDGSVNVSRLPAGLPGSGGFVNIVSATPRLFFCGMLTAGGAKLDLSEPGKVRVRREGRFKKLVRQPRELTFNAGYSREQKVVFVTDRCVIERLDGRLVVTEVYPGIDVQRDILDQAEFPLEVRAGSLVGEAG